MRLPNRLRALLTPANAVALGILLAGIATAFWLQSRFDVDLFSREGAQTIVDRLGWYGPLVYMLAIALAVVVSQLPGVPLAIAAGALWGPVPAGIYSVIGGFVGGMIAYGLGRTLGRSALLALTGRVVSFDTSRGERPLAWIVGVSRALPVVSFDVISYAAGISGMSVRPYAWATFLGMIPSTFLLTFLGGSFVVSPWLAVGLSGVAAALLVALPWILRRYDPLGLRDMVRIESLEAAQPDQDGSPEPS